MSALAHKLTDGPPRPRTEMPVFVALERTERVTDDDRRRARPLFDAKGREVLFVLPRRRDDDPAGSLPERVPMAADPIVRQIVGPTSVAFLIGGTLALLGTILGHLAHALPLRELPMHAGTATAAGLLLSGTLLARLVPRRRP